MAFAAGAAVLLLAVPSTAHELLIDELRLWRIPSGGELRGQLTFDPELTRSLDDSAPRSIHAARVERFVRETLHIEVNGALCTPELEVRELYERGGAAPGDVVMLSCKTPRGLTSLDVGLGARLPKLIVHAIGLHSTNGQTTVLLAGGETQHFGVAVPTADAENPEHVGARLTVPPAVAASPGRLLLEFLGKGVAHVFPKGLDHLLFVLAIAFPRYGTRRVHAGITPKFGASRGKDADFERTLVLLIGVFTLAHTASVGWVWFGGASPPSKLIEPLIAATISAAGFGAYCRAMWKRELPLVALFGVIHGLSFAGTLAPKGFDRPSLVAALFGFNLGIELAHLLFLVMTIGLLHAWVLVVRAEPRVVERYTRRSSFVIGVVGALWTAQRIFS